MDIFASLESIKIGQFSLAKILSTILLLAVCLIVRRILGKAVRRIIERTHLEKSIKSFLKSAVDVVIWIIIILIVADTLGIQVNSLVAIASVVSLALSLSVQDILTNIFSGMTILSTKPFGVGDFIDLGGTTGTVTSLGLFYTVINTADNKVVYMPNSKVVGAEVINYSVNPIRRIELNVAASYDDEPEKVKAALIKAAEMTEGALSEPAPFAGVLNYGSSSIEYSLLVWAGKDDFLPVKFRLTEAVHDAFCAGGVTMTYDHINVHMVENDQQ
ncbi:MAG: mechanosensitive ion channel family protein [Oscillospiraceae bacterium]